MPVEQSTITGHLLERLPGIYQEEADGFLRSFLWSFEEVLLGVRDKFPRKGHVEEAEIQGLAEKITDLPRARLRRRIILCWRTSFPCTGSAVPRGIWKNCSACVWMRRLLSATKTPQLFKWEYIPPWRSTLKSAVVRRITFRLP